MEIEPFHIHEHPLTLLAENGDGEYHCPSCYEMVLDKSYRCRRCKNKDPEGCFACDGEISGSCYVCKQCWPKSYFFHQSCVDELPQMLQVSFRPQCLFQLEEEYSSSFVLLSFRRNIEFECDFCNQSRKGYRYCCYLCNFHVDARCAAYLNKYHKAGQEHLKHISHQHPLIPLKEEVENRKCQMCSKDIHGESFFCGPCQFYIHKSCGELLQHVRHPFHPDHYLTLGRIYRRGERRFCQGCGFEIDGLQSLVYRCDYCDYDLHLECVALKRKIKHEGHHHFLTLLDKDTSTLLDKDSSNCQICGVLIDKGAFYARCLQCRQIFHFQCGSGTASLPPTLVYEDHSHPLLRYTEDLMIKYGKCGVCKEETNQKHPVYVCVKCEYFAHLRCVITEIKLYKREKLEHFSHRHFLFGVEKKMNDDIKCYACTKQIQDHPSYGCDHCRSYLHKACAELPRVIRHRLHDQHLLTLGEVNGGTCDSCHKDILNGFVYRCETCHFILDLDCASPQHPSINCRAGRDIGHYSHHHLLTEVDSDTEMKCKLCDKSIHGVRYGCDSCKFHIHESCAALPPVLQYPFHPLHCLILEENKSEKVYSCGACSFDIESPGVHYWCFNCNFRLHLGCVSLKPNVKYEGHQHLLILVENMSYSSECHACFCKIGGTFFVRCIQCRLDFHVQCGAPTSLLPPTVLNEHHGHLLVLKDVCEEEIEEIGNHHVCCNVCEEEIGKPEHPSYSCVECGYFAHVRCAVTEIPKDAREKLIHFSRERVLFLLENKRNDDRTCCGCQRLIENQSAYGCVQCEYYLHKSCAELPLKMHHLLHRHPFTGMYHGVEAGGQCDVCQKDLNGDYVYICDRRSCRFVLDVDCALLQLRVDFEGGDDKHILSFFEMLPHTWECQEQRPKNGGTSCENCPKCRFNLYLLHSLLPRAIKIESHHHSLELKDSHADDNYNKLVCDVCEEERNLEEGVYYCEECDFVAEFDCVVSEVIRALREKPRDEQRPINRKIADKMIRKGLTIQDMISSIPKEEMQQLNDIVRDIEWGTTMWHEHWTIEMIENCRGNFVQFMDIKKFIELEDWESEVENVGDYKTIPKLAGVLESLIENYGDIGDSCTTFSQGTKSVLLFFLCAIVESMYNTMVCEMGTTVDSWKSNSQVIHRAGIRVDFVFDHLEQICYGRGSLEEVGSEFNELRHIHYHHEEMIKLYRDIMERNQNVDKLSRQQQYIISSIRQETLRSKAERYCEDLENRRMLAGTGLLPLV